jgi:2-iminobutanoate/2-iminopropanoate deaminase
MTTKRRSIDIPGFAHKNPIPAASLKGNILMSGAIFGVDPATHEAPASLAEQCAFLFQHIATIMKEAGGTMEDIVKVSVHLRDTKDRAPLNEEWKKAFPDAGSRPARHVNHVPLPEGDKLIAAEIFAVL